MDQKEGITLFRHRIDSEKLAQKYLGAPNKVLSAASRFQSYLRSTVGPPVPTMTEAGKQRTILIATMEYGIEDWNIKIKIGGLGVMAEY